jgi:hypothetical protein
MTASRAPGAPSVVVVVAACVVAILAGAAPASANTFLLTGVVEADGAPVSSGPLPFVFSLVDGATVLWSEEQPAVDVVDGVFVVDVGAANPLPPSTPAGVRLRIVVDGDELSTVPLARLASATRAARAATAPTAPTTTQLQQRSADAYARADALALPGGAAVAFGNVTGVPADLADGDDGTVVSGTGGGVVLGADHTLGLQDVPGDRLADGSVTGARLPAGAVGAREVADGVVTGALVVDGTLTRSKLAADLTEREVRTKAVFRVVDVACEDELGTLTTKSTCSPSSCKALGQPDKVLACGSTTTCTSVILGLPSCANTAVGALVQP